MAAVSTDTSDTNCDVTIVLDHSLLCHLLTTICNQSGCSHSNTVTGVCSTLTPLSACNPVLSLFPGCPYPLLPQDLPLSPSCSNSINMASGEDDDPIIEEVCLQAEVKGPCMLHASLLLLLLLLIWTQALVGVNNSQVFPTHRLYSVLSSNQVYYLLLDIWHLISAFIFIVGSQTFIYTHHWAWMSW